MLMPKRVKYRKAHKPILKGTECRALDIAFGEFGLKALGRGYLDSRQIEAARLAIVRALKKGGKFWIRVFPDRPVTRKPAETRMGKGKGEPSYWCCVIRPGRVLFEIEGISEEMAKEALTLAGHKLPFRSTFVKRREF
ncbi:MAG: 50S ribosomal protein L16 [Elusimicrobia bacterium]|nr:50S ribosomal protein L16 [Elusimicrobiota bacterium]